jgi:hypothetical protein
MISIKSVPDRSDYQLLFETCMTDLAYVKGQQWKTVHLTLIALAALLIASQQIMCAYISCPFIVLVTFIGLRFLYEHQQALLRYRGQKEDIINAMPDIYRKIHPKKESNEDISFFSCMFIITIVAFAMFVFIYAIFKGGKSMPEYSDTIRIVYISLSYLAIIFGSIGMIFFATKFPFSTSIRDLKLVTERFLGLNGYIVWWLSWSLIIVGTGMQLIDFWIQLI